MSGQPKHLAAPPPKSEADLDSPKFSQRQVDSMVASERRRLEQKYKGQESSESSESSDRSSAEPPAWAVALFKPVIDRVAALEQQQSAQQPAAPAQQSAQQGAQQPGQQPSAQPDQQPSAHAPQAQQQSQQPAQQTAPNGSPNGTGEKLTVAQVIDKFSEMIQGAAASKPTGLPDWATAPAIPPGASALMGCAPNALDPVHHGMVPPNSLTAEQVNALGPDGVTKYIREWRSQGKGYGDF